MNNCYNKKNKNYYNSNYNNFCPLNNNCNLYCDKKNKLKNISCINSLYEVENFLCNINKLSKYLKLIKYLK